MSNLDRIFASYPTDGFQDIWFSRLRPEDVARLFDHACMTWGPSTAPRAKWHRPSLGCASRSPNTRLQDAAYVFEPLLLGSVPLDGVAIRIEHDAFAIDFDPGLDYWTLPRQMAFICWVRKLAREVPDALLEWAHEGMAGQPDAAISALLRAAAAP